jgi:hypothetical protein
VRVLGIDPGTAACGYGIVHESGGRLRAVEHGWWKTPAGKRPELRLRTIFDGVTELIEEYETPVPRSPSGRRAAPCSSLPRRSASSALSTRPRA